MFNATIPFFVFIVCNQQFREMFSIYYLSKNKKQNIQNKYLAGKLSALNSLPPVSRINYRSPSDTHLLFYEKMPVLKVSSI